MPVCCANRYILKRRERTHYRQILVVDEDEHPSKLTVGSEETENITDKSTSGEAIGYILLV